MKPGVLVWLDVDDHPVVAEDDPEQLQPRSATTTSQNLVELVLVQRSGMPARRDDARVLAEYGVAEGVDVVAVFGGDGTPMQAARGLANAIGGMMRPQGLPELNMRAGDDAIDNLGDIVIEQVESRRYCDDIAIGIITVVGFAVLVGYHASFERL